MYSKEYCLNISISKYHRCFLEKYEALYFFDNVLIEDTRYHFYKPTDVLKTHNIFPVKKWKN